MGRAALLMRRVAGDAAAYPRWKRPLPVEIAPSALGAAMEWLALSHDVTGRRGSSAGFDLLRGWLPAYPETTGYVIGTLLAHARDGGGPEHAKRAVEMGEWELEVQGPHGGIGGGLANRPRPPIVFNTGMVLHGWLDLWEAGGDQRYIEAAVRAGRWLVANQDEDGAWRGAVAYQAIPTTYHARVAWALLRLAVQADERSFHAAGVRNLEWALARQRPNGWFDACAFKPRRNPNTHAIAYTLRGLLEAGLLLEDDRYLNAVRLASRELVRKQESIGILPASFDSSWRSASRYVCLTGLAQLGDIWLKLFRVDGDAAWRRAGEHAIGSAALRQERSRGPGQGALPGSFPIFGAYLPLRYLNWATKFLADALMSARKAAAANDREL